jgi:hypothetical protein
MLCNEKFLESLVNLKEVMGCDKITINDKSYKVLTENEIDKEFDELQMDLFNDMGFDAYAEFVKDHILNNADEFIDIEWFDLLQYETLLDYQQYYSDEEWKELAEIYETEDIDELSEYDLKTWIESYSDSVSWYLDYAGENEFFEMVDRHKLLNLEKLSEYIREIDGYDILASYDGDVWEHLALDGDVYYIYRVY